MRVRMFTAAYGDCGFARGVAVCRMWKLEFFFNVSALGRMVFFAGVHGMYVHQDEVDRQCLNPLSKVAFTSLTRIEFK